MGTRSNQKNKSSENKDLDFLKIQYQVLSNRQLSHDNMIWNVPSLLFVAQSLLWTIALDTDVHLLMRCLVSIISTVTGFLSLQLFQRNRLMEIADNEQLYHIEQFFSQLGDEKSAQSAVIIHHQLGKRTVLLKKGSKTIMEVLEEKDFFRKGRLVKMKSFNLWVIAFWIIFGLSVVITFYNVYGVIKAYGLLDFLKS